MDFGRGARGVSLRVKSEAGGTIVLHSDSLCGRELGRIEVPAQMGWTEWRAKVKRVRGVHALVMEFQGAQTDEELFCIDTFAFMRR